MCRAATFFECFPQNHWSISCRCYCTGQRMRGKVEANHHNQRRGAFLLFFFLRCSLTQTTFSDGKRRGGEQSQAREFAENGRLKKKLQFLRLFVKRYEAIERSGKKIFGGKSAQKIFCCPLRFRLSLCCCGHHPVV